ncbi:phage minor tail protein L [Ferribacterium limneticum]|uniref:phage minor tail protein L n=1 Tax=Ferribacterium limneticum TaxID=76259 RepID=UPI001CF819EB|nr:phage minor tail protein L [Ferribacterium limneticum]UCV26805.1 phage minor tail protein L [Ferribacterium limneticum]UCV30722.1 phage minor tail protein L [Ferribacterium limneticum]
MSITSDVQLLAPGALVDLFEVDLTGIGGGTLFIHPGRNSVNTDIVWNGRTYTAFPVKAEGFEATGNGRMPRPTVRVANVTGLISSLLKDFDDLIGCKITRRRTFAKYLDAVNFPGGVNPTANPLQEFPKEVWYIDRKATETKMMVEFELAASWDVQGVLLPRRQCIANTCTWRYRGPDCGYTGGPVADGRDNPTSEAGLDSCGKRLSSCKLRFGSYAVLPFGAFIAVGIIS